MRPQTGGIGLGAEEGQTGRVRHRQAEQAGETMRAARSIRARPGAAAGVSVIVAEMVQQIGGSRSEAVPVNVAAAARSRFEREFSSIRHGRHQSRSNHG